MKKTILMDKYHIRSKSINKKDTKLTNVTQFINYFKEKIESDAATKFIGIFDHYEHTQSLENGEIADSIKDAQNIVFCFGQKIPNPLILAVRPRSIAIAENEDSFIVSFMDAPVVEATAKMESWVNSIK